MISLMPLSFKPSDNISFYIFISAMFCTLFGMLLWLWDLNTIRLGLIVIGLFLYLLAGLLAIFFEKKLKYISFLGKAAVFFYFFFYFYCIIVNQFSNGFHSAYIPNFFWDSGFFFIGIGCLSFIRISKKNLKHMIGFYLVFFLIDIIFTAKYLNPFVAFHAVDRRDSFRLISEGLGHAHKAYHLHTILSALALVFFAITLEYIKEKKWIFLSLLGVIAMLFFGLFYQKRNIFLEIGLFFIFFVLLPSFKITRTGRNLKIFGLITFFGLLGLYFTSELFNSGVNLVLNRFSEGYHKTGANERFEETYFFFRQYDLIYYFFGRGLTSFVPGTEGGNNLHMGMGNFILKGGYFMLSYLTVLLLLNLLYSIRLFFLRGVKILLWIQVFCIFSIYTYLSFWGWFPDIMTLPLSLLIFDINKTFKTDETVSIDKVH